MTIIQNKEDQETIQRTAVSQGVANSRIAALARAVLAADALTSSPKWADGASMELTPELAEKLAAVEAQMVAFAPRIEGDAEAAERLDRIEAALKSIELPDVAALEATIADLTARLAALEEGLGEAPAPAATPDAEAKPAETKGKAKARR